LVRWNSYGISGSAARLAVIQNDARFLEKGFEN
jgi:hypothetical protein